LYAYGQAVLAACLLLPLVQPWQHIDMVPGGAGASRISLIRERLLGRAVTSPAAWFDSVRARCRWGVRLAWLALGFAKLARYRQSACRLESIPRQSARSERILASRRISG